ncbi:MAG: class I SAM-dependent methyltransferase [Puniceicoccaceae bacterium]
MTLFDLHLHWYPGFDAERFRARLSDVAARSGGSLAGVVFDTERTACWDRFRADLEAARQPFEGDGRGLRLRLEGGRSAVFVRGVQWVTEENLEILVIGAEPEYGSLAAMAGEVSRGGGVVIVPWGFGKWTGARGMVLERILAEAPPGLFLGDSANRPASGGPGPFSGAVFERFRAVPRLDGSDPLPLAGDEGFAFRAGVRGPDFEGPAEGPALAGFLRARRGELEPVAAGAPLREAFGRQWRLRRSPLDIDPPRRSPGPGESDRSDLESATNRYARRFSGQVGECFLERQGTLARELAREVVPGPGSLLDVGGGHAQIAPVFKDLGWEVTIFASDETCRARPDRILGPGAYRFETGNLLRLPFADDSFDVVTAFRLVTHETRWERLIGELCRVARRAVIVDYPDVRGFNALSHLLFHLKKAFEKDTRPYAVFNRRRIREAFFRAGAGEVVFRPQFFLPMVFHRMTGSAALLRATEGFFRRAGLTRLFGSPVVVRATPGILLSGCGARRLRGDGAADASPGEPEPIPAGTSPSLRTPR